MMGYQDVDFLFDFLDFNLSGFLTALEIEEFEKSLHFDEALDIAQIDAAINTVCKNVDGLPLCRKNDFRSLLNELERRRDAENRAAWDFKALDVERNGKISLEKTMFLFKAVHEDRFSLKFWNSFLQSRWDPTDYVSFSEVKLFLCSVVPYEASMHGDFLREYSTCRKRGNDFEFQLHKSLISWQQDEGADIVADQRRKQARSDGFRSAAGKLLNRIDESGPKALLRDSTDDESEFVGSQPLERVGAFVLLDALKKKHDVLREKLLTDMIRIYIGEGMWTAFSEQEQEDRVLKLKAQEEQLRREGRIKKMASTLPGAKHQLPYGLVKLMGVSVAEQLVTEQAITERMKETGRMKEDIEEEFDRKIEDKYAISMTTDELVIALTERIDTERDILSLRLQGLNGFATMTAKEREEYLMILLLIHLRSAVEPKFQGSALAAGLTERLLGHRKERDDKEQERQEALAKQRLTFRRGKKSLPQQFLFPSVSEKKEIQGKIDIKINYMEQVERYFAYEREYMMHFLQGKELVSSRQKARKMKQDERSNELLVLKTQWTGWKNRPEEEKLVTLEYHRKILQQAAAITFESRKDEMKAVSSSSVDDLDTAANILSELQQLQDSSYKTLLSFEDKDSKEIGRLQQNYSKAAEEEAFDNIAIVLLGIKDMSKEQEEMLKALEDKYDVLRDKLILEGLKKQYGEAEWKKLSEQQRQSELLKRKLQEKKLRREGKLQEAEKLLGDAIKDNELVCQLMGMNRQQYLEKLKERLRQRRKAGEDVEDDERELEELENAEYSGNVLSDLQNRFEEEKDALFRRLQEGDKSFLNEKDRQAELARLRLEKRRAERENNFSSAAIVIGLAERNQATKSEQLMKDRQRQEKLARERLEARKKAKRKKEEEIEEPLPAKGDINGWQEAVMKELEKKHVQERNFFIDLLQDENSEDLRDEARVMNEAERWGRLNQLMGKREELDFGLKVDQEEHGAIMEMAASVKLVIRETISKMSQSAEQVSRDDIIGGLLADLQEQQDKETVEFFQLVLDKEQDELAVMKNEQSEARKYQKMDNIATVVFKYEGPGSDDELLKALNKKYDTLTDKLLLDALKKQLSDAEWAALSEKDRQARLIKLKLEQKRLLKEGRLDEAAKLLGDGFEADANLKKLMGENRARYDELLKEKLARRRERLAKGLPPDEEDDVGLEEDEISAEGGSVTAKDLLQNLMERYEDEKDALMARLKGADEKFMSEKERQAELVRLKREQRKAQAEDKFDAAALVLGLAERNQAAAEERLKNDRARQEQLAKERLARMREKRKEKEELKIQREGNTTELQEAVMRHIERRHSCEREVLLHLLQTGNQDLLEGALCLTQGNREARLEELKEKWFKNIDVNKEILQSILEEMSATKFACRENKLKAESEDATGIEKDGIVISLIADLQETQDKESEQVLQNIITKNAEELILMQEKQEEIEAAERWENVVHVLGSPEKIKLADEAVLLDALESKYDALKDKLILDALEKQMGDAEWARLSERERQAKLMKLKLEERRLKKEGKFDEAARLLGDAFANDVQLQAMLGDTRARQEQRLKERLENRKKRQTEGMSEEEIDRLEEEEEKAYEDEIAKSTKGNVLLDLQKNFEDEKEALLNALRGADSRFLSERQRQAELARLRRDQRKARKEDTFDAAAMVLGTAKAHQAALDAKFKSDRERQEKLARERLLARKNRKLQAEKDDEVSKELKPSTESNDPLVLQESVLNEMERKHTGERDLLVQLLNESEANEWRDKARSLDRNVLHERLFEMKQLRSQWRELPIDEIEEYAEDQLDILKESTALKIEAVLNELKEEGKPELTDEAASVKILADLQDNQDQESEYLMKGLSTKSVATLRQLIQVQSIARQGKWYDNVAAALFGFSRAMINPEKDFEENIVDALAQKYDALKEKLFIEVLKRKFGDEEWEKMTEKEKLKHLAKLKAEEKMENVGNDERFADVEIPNMEAVVERTRMKQEKKLKARMERKRKAKELGVDESEIKLESDETENEETVSGSNILKNLQNQFEEEKEALLALLRGADAKMMNEKQRQLALAKLRREQKRIKRENNFDDAAIVFSLAKQNQKQVEASYESERARQEQLARDRIAARRKKRMEQIQEKKHGGEKVEEDSENAFEAKLLSEYHEDMADDVKEMSELQREGSIALHEGVLIALEKKHNKEVETLMELLKALESDIQSCDAASQLSESQRLDQRAALLKERDDWKNMSKKSAMVLPPSGAITENDIKANAERILTEQKKQLKIFHNALLLLLGSKKQELLDKGHTEEEIMEEVSVLVLADLQEKQRIENNAISKLLEDKDQALLSKIKEEQRVAKREGWFDNLAATIFGSRTTRKKVSTSGAPNIEDIVEISEDAEEAIEQEEEQRAQLESLNEEIEREKEKRRLQGLSEDEIANALAELQRQQEAKRQAILAQGERQRERAKQRMEERRRKLEEKRYEEDIAVSMVTMASKQSQLLREKTMLDRSKQADSLEERLRKRREERKRRAEEQAQKEKEEEEKEQKEREDAEKKAADKASKDTEAVPLPPGMALRREKTVVQEAAEMEDSKKAEILNFLLREHTTAAMRIRREQTRQEEMVQILRSKRKQRIEKREEEAATIIGIGERQKTILEKHKKDERERQISVVRERVSRIRHERTMTMKEPNSENQGKGFENFLNSDEMNNLSEDDKMARIAKEMEKKFREEGVHMPTTPQESEPMPDDKSQENEHPDVEASPSIHTGKLDDKAKEQILKERLAQKKRTRRKEKQGASENNKEENASTNLQDVAL